MAETHDRRLSDALDVAQAFVQLINKHDAEALAGLMTPDHVFIDIPGHQHRGREHMLTSWRGYFAMFPDYRIEVVTARTRDDLVILVGRSSGKLSDYGRGVMAISGQAVPEEGLQGPAIWTARIRDGLVAEWRIYWDSPAVRAKLGVA